MVLTKTINEALVYYDEAMPNGWLDARGNVASKFILGTGEAMDSVTGLPDRFITTLVNLSTVINSTTAGEKLKITTAGAEYDGACLKAKGEAFKCDVGKPFYFGVRMKISNATSSEFVVGIGETLTAYMAAAAHTVVAANLEGLFFHKPSDATVIYVDSYQTNVQKLLATVGTAEDTLYHNYEIFWTGGTAYFYFDGVLVSSTAADLPDGDLSPFLHFRTGAVAARTCEIAWFRAIQLN
jgi:hypothetical protein